MNPNPDKCVKCGHPIKDGEPCHKCLTAALAGRSFRETVPMDGEKPGEEPSQKLKETELRN